ncbi:hypothetical protein [Geodermatophilus sp. SYSU D00700]
MADLLRVTVQDRVGWIEYDRPPVDACHWAGHGRCASSTTGPCSAPRRRTPSVSSGLARKPARALAAIRRSVTGGVDLPFDEGLAIEREEAVALGAARDSREEVDAFLGRRPPSWSD